jgi:hypothetical protein
MFNEGMNWNIGAGLTWLAEIILQPINEWINL